MQEKMYTLGYSVGWVIPLAIALFCIWKIRKNRREIKAIEEEMKRKERISPDAADTRTERESRENSDEIQQRGSL